MLTLESFNRLGLNEKAEATWQEPYLADRFEADFAIQLYAVSDFYVEVFYNRSTNAITCVEAFADKSKLIPYLDRIGITSF